ncbi:uncharacterized protein LOC143041693 isoform X3 [Oratosquilla oratoria]|uniref:uncharacterized protein LOC143041693 isoform X3 n=1 Tax=Oratosquilla oratoria TaxID=337810 RepID=UPI003F758E06
MAKLILASREELEEMKRSLEPKFPHSFVVHGYIEEMKCSLEPKFPHLFVAHGYIDLILRYDIEDFKTKVMKAEDPKLNSVVVILDSNSKVSEDELACLISSIPELDDKTPVVAYFCSHHILVKLVNLVKEGKLWSGFVHHPQPDGYTYTIDNNITEPSLPSGMWFGCLDKSHTDLVQENWRYGNLETREIVSYYLEKLPSAAIFVSDGDSARPVSWIQSYKLGSIGNTFTLPEYRRKGLASAVTLTLAKKVAAIGRPVYLMIEDYNEDSKRMHEKMGFRKACLMKWHFFLPPGVSFEHVWLQRGL